MKHRTLNLALLAVGIVASGCGVVGSPADLDGEWILTGGTHDGAAVGPIEGTTVTLRIAGDEVGGIAACNHYGGTISRDGATISIGALSMTEMGCEEPIMALESAYLAALADVDTASRVGDVLTLSGSGVELDFDLVPPEADAGLVGTEWLLESQVSGDAVASVLGEATLVFSEDGTVTGSTGCRSFSADYELDGTTLRIGDFVTDMRACADDLGGQDTFILDLLGSDLTISIEGGRLSLRSGDLGLDYRAG